MARIREHAGVTLWSEDLERALNAQIGVELSNFASYEQLSCFFRSAHQGNANVATFFRQEADEELKHARSFMDYQTMRGGVVTIMPPELHPSTPSPDSVHPCLDAYITALELEKATYVGLLALHKLAEDDPSFQDYLEDSLREQLETQKTLNDEIQRLARAPVNVAEYIHETIVRNDSSA